MGAQVSRLADRLIEDVNWSTYEVANGPATRVGGALRALLASSDAQEASEAWSEIEEFIFSQGTIYSSAEPAVSVLLAALAEEQPPWRSGRILDLLFFIASGTSAKDSKLRERCRNRTREGLWLLARWAIVHDGWGRDNALEVIEVVAPHFADLIRDAIVEASPGLEPD